MSSDATSQTEEPTRLWWLSITVLGLLADQFSKYWMTARLSSGEDIDVIRGFLKFSYTENPGIAFGMLNHGNMKWLLVSISVVAIGVVVYYLTRTSASNRLLLWSLALLAAGISGNLIDRVRLGRVIDFILLYYRDYKWPVFNVADTAITIGAALMAIELFVGSQSDQPKAVSPVVERPLAGSPIDEQ